MQNEKTLQQSIQEYESNMPPEIIKLIQSFDWKREVRTIVNQNQLMIDVGSDLEESIYLMMLGVIDVEDLYNRLIDIHEIPEDKTKKIIEEIEQQIFNPLYKKITELDGESESVSSSSVSSITVPHRDEIIAEIEKEPEPLIKLNLNATPSTDDITNSKNETSSNPVQNDGIVKSFAISSKEPIMPPPPPPIESTKIVEGAIENPIKATLQNPTITINPEQKPKGYVPDPYREPIE